MYKFVRGFGDLQGGMSAPEHCGVEVIFGELSHRHGSPVLAHGLYTSELQKWMVVYC